MDRFYSLAHSSIDFHFKQSPRDFVVEEIPLYEEIKCDKQPRPD